MFQGLSNQGHPTNFQAANAAVAARQSGYYGDDADQGAFKGESCFACLTPRNILIIAAIALFLGWVMGGVGVGNAYWASFSVTTGTITIKSHQGLWQACAGPVCVDTIDSNTADWYKVCQSFGVLGSLFGLGALIALVFWLCCDRRQSSLLKMVIICLSIASAASLAVAAGLYANNYKDTITTYDLDWCFYLVCVGAFFVLVAGIMIIFVPAEPKQDPDILQFIQQQQMMQQPQQSQMQMLQQQQMMQQQQQQQQQMMMKQQQMQQQQMQRQQMGYNMAYPQKTQTMGYGQQYGQQYPGYNTQQGYRKY